MRRPIRLIATMAALALLALPGHAAASCDVPVEPHCPDHDPQDPSGPLQKQACTQVTAPLLGTLVTTVESAC